MKKIIFLAVLCISIGVFIGMLLFVKSQTLLVREPNIAATPSPIAPRESSTVTEVPEKTVTYKSAVYTYRIVSLVKNSTISLIQNTKEKIRFRDIVENNRCTAAINAGFYDTNDVPIGLFVINHREVVPSQKNALFNGFVTIPDGSSVFIRTGQSTDSAQYAFQTGPVVIYNNEIRLLSIKNDEPDRRMVLLSDSSNQSYFLSIMGAESVTSGPKLADVPGIVAAIGSAQSILITEAINLDGGSASALYDGTRFLEELMPVGSVLCVK